MLLLNNGVRLEVVAKVLGHSSVKITEKVYASVLKKTVAMEMSKMLDK
jgi:site-specific recombinase XerD